MKRRDFVVYAPTIAAAAAAAAMSFAPIGNAQAQTWFGLDTQAGPSGTWKKLLTKTNFQFNYTFPAGTSLNFNIRNAALSAGWNGTDIIDATITIPSTSTIGSTSGSIAAFDTDTGYPDGSSVKIVLDGYVVGFGGKGGTASSSAGVRSAGAAGGLALLVRYPTEISGAGVLGGGGGGGGAGEGGLYYFTYCSSDDGRGGCNGYSTEYDYFGGGGGGEGAGLNRGGGGVCDHTMTAGIRHGWASNGYGASLTNGGGGGASSYGSNGPNDYMRGGYGGNGGGLGQAGSSGGGSSWAGECCFYPTPGVWYPATAGGSPGIAIQGNSLITWASSVTKLGAILA